MKKLILLISLIPSLLFAANEQINEDQLFSGNETVIENKSQDKSPDISLDKRSVGISGQIIASALYSHVDESSPNYVQGTKSFIPSMIGDLNFDARLPGGYKGFGLFEIKHDASVDEDTSSEKQTTYSAKELFVDFNINRAVYFRAGKQVLQWGQCYLWNPTDMINIEKISFLSKIESREGTDGLKMHIPFGTTVNIYGFANVDKASDGNDVAGAGKFEFLVKGTEMAFSAWGKKEYHPVYGYDFSTRVLGIDLKGEASYSHGSNTKKAVIENGTTLATQTDDEKDIFKASINIGRDFDFGERANSLNISFEMFYNGDGYSGNPFEDKNKYMLLDKKTYIMANKLYEPNYFSKYYAAIFITIKEFIISDLTFKLNGITNIQHKSYIVSSGLSYTNINNFTAGITVNAFLGDENGEYRVMAMGSEYTVQVTAGIIF